MAWKLTPGNSCKNRMFFAIFGSLLLHVFVIFWVRAGGIVRTQDIHTGAAKVQIALISDKHDAATVEESRSATLPEMKTTAGDFAPPPPTLPAEITSTPQENPGKVGSGKLPLDFRQINHYYPSSQLQRPPAPQDIFRFDYPESTVKKGYVIARLLINDRGTVDEVIVEKAEPIGVFEAITVATLLKQRFSPGLIQGQPVPSQVTLEFRYENPNQDASAAKINAERF